MKYVADLHLHSKYSRAVSQSMNLETMSEWAAKKGIDILSTGDWTHPLWFRQIKESLVEASQGLYELKSKIKDQRSKVRFLLSVEVSSIYSQGGKVRRIHNLIFAPSFETVEKVNRELLRRGVNLSSDGRPIMGISSAQLLEIVLTIDKNCLLIPCHAWTPWFSLYGSNSGFDSIEECFPKLSKYIFGVETGLSSDPEMNWRIKELDNRSILSFSDAHSPAKMGREATVFELEKPTFENIRKAIMYPVISSQLSVVGSKSVSLQLTGKQKTDNRILYTIEFYPEEGKYHYTGHRNCGVVQTPDETKERGTVCPSCKRLLTVGVMQRVQDLAREFKNQNSKFKIDEYGVKWIEDPKDIHPPFVRLVPLLEIISESLSSTVASLKVKEAFDRLVDNFGSEINILLKTGLADIERVSGSKVSDGIKKVRTGDITIAPGFDGEFGKVKIWKDDGQARVEIKAKEDQLGLF